MQKKSVLICDDDEDILEVCKVILSEDYDVKTVSQCENILQEIENTNPDIVLMDVLMPGSGKEAIRAIKENEETAHLPVILFSAMDDLEKIKENVHATAIIQKPFSIELFKKTLEKHIL